MVGDHSATAALLLKHGAKVNAHDGEGNTPLHVAVIQRNVDLAKMLLENSADANARNGDGRTPLHLAVEQAEMAGLLLKQGADRELRDHDGKTPLDISASAVDNVSSLGTRAKVRALLLKR
jgi:ankyrin repeat protein